MATSPSEPHTDTTHLDCRAHAHRLEAVLANVIRERDALQARLDAELTADNGETWESECMRARSERDALRAQLAERPASPAQAAGAGIKHVCCCDCHYDVQALAGEAKGGG